MKNIISTVAVAISVCGFVSTSAHAGDASGFHVNHESGVKVFRGSPTHMNYQAITALRSVDIAEKSVDNQNRQADAQLKAQSRQAKERLELDRRVAFTQNEIFSSSRENRSNRRFVTGVNGSRVFRKSGQSHY